MKPIARCSGSLSVNVREMLLMRTSKECFRKQIYAISIFTLIQKYVFNEGKTTDWIVKSENFQYAMYNNKNIPDFSLLEWSCSFGSVSS